MTTSQAITRTRITTGLASESDDAELRRLLRDNPMEGKISLTLEREPSFFLGASVEGEHHCVAVARKEGRIIGLGTRSSRQVWLNGRVDRLGYLSQLRVDGSFRGPGVLRAGFKEFRALHSGADCKLYVTTIVEDNVLARRLLEAEWKDKPHYERLGTLATLVLPLSRPCRTSAVAGLELRHGTPSDLEDIAACLQRNYAKYQFAPYWTAQMLGDEQVVRGLKPQDFLLAISGGRLVGVLATWDQSGFKQTVVRGYQGNLGAFRPWLNCVKRFTGLPHFPRAGEAFTHLYLSHVAVDGDDPSVFRHLLSHAFASSRARGYDYLTLGFCEGHPLLRAALEAFAPLVYRSFVYLAYYEEDAPLARQVTRATPHLELAVL